MAPIVVGIDTGGTFTDFVLLEGGQLRVHKVPSTPNDPSQAILDGLSDLGLPEGASEVLVVHGSTVATNALLERKGVATALVTTEGLEDLLEIGRQARPRLYDLDQELPLPLAPPHLRFGARERVGADGQALLPLSKEEARRVAAEVKASGARAVAVSLLFSFLNPAHEELLQDALEALEPAPFLSISSQLLPQYREYERTSTVAVNAYVGPLMAAYLRRLEEALAHGAPRLPSTTGGVRTGRSFGSAQDKPRLRVMQSSGGGISAQAAAAQPVRTILSGPAGGVVGAFTVAKAAGYPQVITLDMGGTSTDVALCPGRIQETAAAAVGGLPVSVPMIDIHTVGAGGGSIARVDAGGALRVGPESAGADPGPACYGRGEDATVTDANLLLGRMDPGYFLGGRMALDPQGARRALERLAAAMGEGAGEEARQRAAAGVVRVVNATMERALRAISLERGFDPRQFTLLAFGGAGPQHACELAQELRIPRVLAPRFPGALSAYGVAIADVVKDYSRTLLLAPGALTSAALAASFRGLETQARQELRDEGVSQRRTVLHRLLEMRYVGQSYELTVDCPALGRRNKGQGTRNEDQVARAAVRRFHEAHQGRYGYADPAQPVELVNIRLKAVGLTEKPPLGGGTRKKGTRNKGRGPMPLDWREVWFAGGRVRTAFYLRSTLEAGDALVGPAVLLQEDATTVLPPGWAAVVDDGGNLVVEQAGL